MNCLALEQGGEALLVDCGVTFDGRGLGVDVVHPDFTALEGLHVAGLFVTHGHEDHIGAIPYLVRRIDMPVFGPRYALGLVRERAAEHEILDHVDLREVTPRQRRARGQLRRRAGARDTLDRRRHGPRHPHARGPGGAHGRLQVRRRAARRRDVRRGALRGARGRGRAPALQRLDQHRRARADRGRARRGGRARGHRLGGAAGRGGGDVRLERPPAADARRHREAPRAQAGDARAQRAHALARGAGHAARHGRERGRAVHRVAQRSRCGRPTGRASCPGAPSWASRRARRGRRPPRSRAWEGASIPRSIWRAATSS